MQLLMALVEIIFVNWKNKKIQIIFLEKDRTKKLIIQRQSSVKPFVKRHLQPSILYCLLIGIIRLGLSRVRIENRLYTLNKNPF